LQHCPSNNKPNQARPDQLFIVFKTFTKDKHFVSNSMSRRNLKKDDLKVPEVDKFLVKDNKTSKMPLKAYSIL
jgi:hypothetical protein